MKILSLFFLILFLVSSEAHSFCFEEAGQQYGVSPSVLQAIAGVESNFNPRAVNYNRNGTFDYGVMQINSSWYKTLGKDLWASLADPCTNVKVGAWILSDCIKRNGNTWEAVGCYNARSEYKRNKYAWRVYNYLSGSNHKPAKKQTRKHKSHDTIYFVGSISDLNS